MPVTLIVARLIARCRRMPEPGHMPQRWLPQIAPQPARPDKRLVVKAGGKQWGDAPDQRAEIILETRPGMLARRPQPIIEGDVGGAAIGFGKAARFELNQRGGFLRPRRKYPDRKSTRLNSSHTVISYAVFCLKKK